MEEVKILQSMDGELHIALSGDIDLGNAEAFYNDVMQAYQANKGNIVFECADLNFTDKPWTRNM